jgi:hypothetical protein
MNIMKKLKDILEGALGFVGMIVSLLRGGKEGAAAAGPPAKGKGTGSKKPPAAKGGTEEAKAKHSAVAKKKKAGKPVAARKATPPQVAGKRGTSAPATQVKQAAASVSVKGSKKAADGSVSKG